MRTERNVMIAASRSRPECNASERTPKLPVRTTRNVLRETSRKAEPTLSSAARFFSRTRDSSSPTIHYLQESASQLLVSVHRSVLAWKAKTRYFLGQDQETLS